MRALAKPNTVVAPDESIMADHTAATPFPDNIRYYGHITFLLFAALFGSVLGIALIHLNPLRPWLSSLFGPFTLQLIEMYFWGALGGTISAYKFLARDKDQNEVESLKKKPDPENLRYPNRLDVALYAQWVLISGVLAVLGAIVSLAGLFYFEAGPGVGELKRRMFLTVFAFLVGFFQNDFLVFLADLSRRLFRQRGSTKAAEEASS